MSSLPVSFVKEGQTFPIPNVSPGLPSIIPLQVGALDRNNEYKRVVSHSLFLLIQSSNSHFEIQPKNSPPVAGCFWAPKRRVRARRARTLRFEAHTKNCWIQSMVL